MSELGYIPRIPVDAHQLADPVERKNWINNKNMMVFSFIHSKHSFEVVDIFIQEPKPFEELYKNRLEVKAFNSVIDVLGKSDLIEMKKDAGRDKDLFDVQQLEKTK